MSFMNRFCRSVHRVGLLALGVLALAAGPGALAQQASPDGVLQGFEPTGDYLFTIDGVEQPKAKIYQSQRAAALLVRSPGLESPLLVSPRSGSLSMVPIMSLALRPDGTADILADAALQAVGGYTFDGEDVVFTLDGHEMRIKPRPALTGLHAGGDLRSYNPDYVQTAADYDPDQASLDALRAIKRPVRVRVFFGSWCSFCKRYVPRLLKVQEALGDTAIKFEYYGLPHDFSDEAEAKRNDVHGVPTGIVYVDGKEIGRIERNAWSRPEITLRGLLGGG